MSTKYKINNDAEYYHYLSKVDEILEIYGQDDVLDAEDSALLFDYLNAIERYEDERYRIS